MNKSIEEEFFPSRCRQVQITLWGHILPIFWYEYRAKVFSLTSGRRLITRSFQWPLVMPRFLSSSHLVQYSMTGSQNRSSSKAMKIRLYITWKQKREMYVYWLKEATFHILEVAWAVKNPRWPLITTIVLLILGVHGHFMPRPVVLFSQLLDWDEVPSGICPVEQDGNIWMVEPPLPNHGEKPINH